MKKIISLTIMLLIMIFDFSFCSFAVENDYDNELSYYSKKIIGELDDETKEMLEKIGLSDVTLNSINDFSVKRLFSEIKNLFLSKSGNLTYFVSVLSVLCIILSLVKSIGNIEICENIMYMIVTSYCLKYFFDVLTHFADTFSLDGKFLYSITPILTILLSFSGNITFSSVYSCVGIGVSQLLSHLGDTILIPFVCIYMAVIISVSQNDVINIWKISETVNKASYKAISIITGIFSLYLGFQNSLSRELDGIIYKSGKSLLTNLIPVVGPVVSNSLGYIIGSVNILKGTLGIFCLLTLIIINLPCLIELIMICLGIFLVSLICDIFELNNIRSFFGCIMSLTKLLLGLLIFELMMIIISLGLVVLIRGETT